MRRRTLGRHPRPSSSTGREPSPINQTSAPSNPPVAAVGNLTSNELPSDSLPQSIEDFLLECHYRCNSSRTLETRKVLLSKFHWFLVHQGFSHCTPQAIKAFILYLKQDHHEDGGRWGIAYLKQPLSPISIKDYAIVLRLFFDWLVKDEFIEASPMAKIPIPSAQWEQVRPFTGQQILDLVKAARKSVLPLRNEAIIWFLVDTGVRASELCELRVQDLDMQERRCVVKGKGNKRRYIYFGRNTHRVLRDYLRHQNKTGEAAVFTSDRGISHKEALTRNGLLQLIERLGKAAGLQAVRCSPHTFRHTFAVEFLRAGGNQFSLKELLGHTTLHMTNKYVALAQADIQAQHRQFSPSDRLAHTSGEI